LTQDRSEKQAMAGHQESGVGERGMATVIPLVASPVGRARGVLERRVGSRAIELPAGLGRRALRLEHLLAHGPTAIDPVGVAPAIAIAATDRLLRAAAGAIELISAEAEVLGDALGTEIVDVSMDRLGDLAEAVLALSMAPPTAPAWGRRAGADAAVAVLEAAATDLRTTAHTHARLYERWTEAVWDIPDHRLVAGRRRWRVVARVRLARELRAVSRTGRLGGGVTAAATEIIEARAARDRRDALAPLVAAHLGSAGRGPLSDVDAALEALATVRSLQAVLGDRLQEDRLARLLDADAFRSHDVVGPAVTLRSALRAWRTDVAGVNGLAVPGQRLEDLATWAEECCALLPALTHGHAEMVRLGLPAPSLASLVDALALREHVEELLEPTRAAAAARRAGSAS
jgi:hypothetical protein